MITKTNIELKGVELNPIIETCPACNSHSAQIPIWVKFEDHFEPAIDTWEGDSRAKTLLRKSPRIGYSFTISGREENVYAADYQNTNLGSIFVLDGGNEFVGLICDSCGTLYKPLQYQQENIRLTESWGIWFRTKNGDLQSFVKSFDTKIATGVRCDDCGKEVEFFYIKKYKGKIYHFCNKAPNRCDLSERVLRKG
ncbi:MAG: hypothetical protein QW814_02730 [Methanothrix sp.]